MRRILAIAGAAGISALAMTTPVGAQQIQNRTITIDENGNGTVSDGSATSQLDSSLLDGQVLLYGMPSNWSPVPGVVVLTEGDTESASDYIAFVPGCIDCNSQLGASIAFLSDSTDGSDALADTPFFDNVSLSDILSVSQPEVGLEGGADGASYTPGPNDPGYVPGFAVTYNFISDSAVPEPGTWAMMLVGFGAIGWTMRRRNARLTGRAQPA